MSVVTISINGIEKSFERSDVIICKNEEEAQTLFEALSNSDYTWCDGSELKGSYSFMQNEGFGYCFDCDGLSHSSENWFRENTDYENNKKQFNIMYFDELFYKKITLDELYEVVKAVVLDEGMKPEELNQCFNLFSFENIIKENTPQSLVEKYKNWNKSKENKIEIGDIFEYTEKSGKTERYIVLSIDNDTEGYYNVIWEDFTQSTYRKGFILEDKKIGHKTVDL